jgi:hypothetical protein
MLSFHILRVSTVRHHVVFVDINSSIAIFVEPVASINNRHQLAAGILTDGNVPHEA